MMMMLVMIDGVGGVCDGGVCDDGSDDLCDAGGGCGGG